MAPIAPIALNDLLQRTVGAIEISTWILILLFGFETAQTYIYFCNFSSDRRALKYTVFAIWVCNLALIICLCWGLDIVTIVEYGNLSDFGKAPWADVIAIIPAVIADRLVQLVLAQRIYRLTHSLPILCFFLTLITTCLVGNIYAVYEVIKVDCIIVQFQRDNTALMGGILVLEAVIDICLTIAVCYWLRRGRRDATRRTLWQLDTLIMWSIETGTLTSLVCLGTAFCFFYVKDSYAWVAMWTSIPGLYSNSLLALMNGRAGLSGSTNYISCTLPFKATRPRPSRGSSFFFAGGRTPRQSIPVSPSDLSPTHFSHKSVEPALPSESSFGSSSSASQCDGRLGVPALKEKARRKYTI